MKTISPRQTLAFWLRLPTMWNCMWLQVDQFFSYPLLVSHHHAWEHCYFLSIGARQCMDATAPWHHQGIPSCRPIDWQQHRCARKLDGEWVSEAQ
jgi:hypothetical protein